MRTWGDDGIYDHKLTYAVDRRLTTVENSLGHKTQYEHDGAMVRRTIDAFGNTRRIKYGDGYCVLEEIDELGQKTVCVYDERGNLTMSLGPDQTTMVLIYDSKDHLTSALDVLGGKWTWTRDDKGRLVEKTGPLARGDRQVLPSVVEEGRLELRPSPWAAGRAGSRHGEDSLRDGC